ncbi:baseplate morphogenetic protein A [Staphylococcus phage Twort]|uniref:ORF050 n=2 Tax=Staphylococcus phage Twort (strain DSM 17442 / HER 48) TaxID=2908167 RepID=Q4Z9D2_BPTWO|nr:baseplate protein [Staphylococcus phage Twort]AAX92345.1 ORF050 [Staphylococcus phage Twort]QIW89118.1 baseplate morphogenetic protein A [Staphylococcus phage Twort]
MRFKKHEVTYGETMQAISQKYFNTPSYWIDLIEHNNLKYPYIVETDEEKKENPEHLVTYGDTLIIPSEEELSNVSLQELNKKDIDTLVELSLGRDLNITSDESYFNMHGTSDEILSFNDNGNGDLDVVKGISNIKQQLQTRLLTPQGSLLMHPDYGSNIHNLFTYNTVETATLIEMEVTRTLKVDTRVENVNLIDWTIKGNEYKGEFEVTIRSVENSIRFVLDMDDSGIVALFE